MKSLNKFASWLTLVLMAALCQFRAAAAIQTFTTVPSFTGALQSGYYLENFNAVSDTGPFNFEGVTDLTPNIAYSFSASGGVTVFGPTGARSISTFGQGDVLVITFTGNRPTAIGGDFFWTTFSEAVAGSVQVKYGGGDSEFIDVPLSGGGSFAGITTDNALGFSSISMSLVGYTSGDYFPTVDNFYVGIATPVPEAGTWVAGAFIGLFVVTRTGWGIMRRRLARQ